MISVNTHDFHGEFEINIETEYLEDSVERWAMVRNEFKNIPWTEIPVRPTASNDFEKIARWLDENFQSFFAEYA